MEKANRSDARGDDRGPGTERSGISNRESAAEEERERREHPPVDTGSPPAEDAAGRVGDEQDLSRDGHTSHKVPGAFGKEPKR